MNNPSFRIVGELSSFPIQENRPLCYLFSLGYIAVMLFLVQFKFLSADLALYFIFLEPFFHFL